MLAGRIIPVGHYKNKMPTYTLKDTRTLQEFDVTCSWEELQERIDHMPDLVQVMKAPKIIGGTGDMYSRIPSGFKDVLSRVKTGSAKNNTIK